MGAYRLCKDCKNFSENLVATRDRTGINFSHKCWVQSSPYCTIPVDIRDVDDLSYGHKMEIDIVSCDQARGSRGHCGALARSFQAKTLGARVRDFFSL